MADIHFNEVVDRVVCFEAEEDVMRAAAVVANAIRAGLGGMIRGTMMEDDLRKALRLRDDEMVNFRIATDPTSAEAK